MFEKLVVVTRKTRLQELVERFNTRAQARFHLERAGGDFEDYLREDETYARALATLRGSLELGLKLQFVERSLVPTFLFTEKDLVVVAGQDGLVANVAKYAGAQPIVAVNPDPARFDGVLLPFGPAQARLAVSRVLEDKAQLREVTLAEARLADGQRLLAFNDLFVGARTHVSARYRIGVGAPSEPQSSSGVIVSTGAGSTGWLSSVFNMAAGVAAFGGGQAGRPLRLEWEDPRLAFVVREPFASRHSSASLVAGLLEPGEELVLESLMPASGVVFSDGVEADALAFDAGAVARIRAAAQRKPGSWSDERPASPLPAWFRRVLWLAGSGYPRRFRPRDLAASSSPSARGGEASSDDRGQGVHEMRLPIGSLCALALAAALPLTLAACSEEPVPEPQCADGQTACGSSCCAAGEVCDAATTTCKVPVTECAGGQTACGQVCCTAEQVCDAATTTCKPKTEAPQCQSGETVCGQECCTASETCDAATATCKAAETPDQLERCYSQASFAANAFASDQGLEVDEDGYEYYANHKVDGAYAQMLRVGLFPLSETTRLTGTFDLADEPFTFAECERCVLVTAGKSTTAQKHYLAEAGTLTVTEVNATRMAGSLSNVRLVEVTIDETTLATARVEGGCTLQIPSLSFEYGAPVDPRIEQCFLPESFEATQFSDYVWPYEANDYGYFYRAIQMPAVAGQPQLTLFVEVYDEGTGTFSLGGCETNSASCEHFVIIEAQAISGAMKSYVGHSGRLVLTELSEEAMVGRLEQVELVETEIDGSSFTPVSDGCTTRIDSLEFSSRNATQR